MSLDLSFASSAVVSRVRYHVFIFDNQSEKKSILAEWDDYLSWRPEVERYYGAAPRFEDDQTFLPLQAADLWAWQVREWYEWDDWPVPKKMHEYDFGTWKGKKRRPVMALNYTVEGLKETLTGGLWRKIT